MDQELIAYLDARFRETSQEIQGFRQETAQRFEQIDSRFEQIDSRFEQTDSRFEQIDSRFEQTDSRFEQIDSRFERVETAIRHTHVLVEGLRSDIQMLGEGVMGIDEKLRYFRADVEKEFEATRSMINPPYADLNNRVQSLEAWRERSERDPMDLIRERFGKKL
jgi:chromosome segregation ATPase